MIGDDLSPFFVPGEFAGEGDTLDGAPITGIFDAAYVSTNEGIGLASARPVYTVPASALPATVEGSILFVAKTAETFRVVEPQADGTGVVLLMLEKA